MLENFMNLFFWVCDLRTRSRDPVLNEYRGYQWRMVISLSGALFIMLMGWLFIPEVHANNQYFPILSALITHVQQIFDLLTLAFIGYFLMNAIMFLRFYTKHGILE